jgi:HlyD family secretion protein
MDVQRSPKIKRWKKIRVVVIAVLAIAATAIIGVKVSRLKPADPTVDRATVWIDTVKRGTIMREVRGNGTLVPEDVRFIPAPVEGRVEKVHVKSGMEVSFRTVLVELVNPTLEQQATDAEYQTKAAESDLANLKVKLESERMTQHSLTASVQAEYSQAKLQLDTDEELGKSGLVPELTLKLSRVKLKEIENRLKIEQQRLDVLSKSAKSQIDSQQTKIDQFRALAKLKRSQVESLKITAGTNGIVQEVSVQEGQQLTTGTNIARVADQTTLRAELRIAETQAKNIQVGQKATIDTRNGLIQGSVSRIDASIREGTIGVDVRLEGTLPQGARPDLSVEGTIELEKLNNVIYVGRPAFGQGNSTVGFFKLEPDGKTTVCVQIKIGKTSASTVEIKEGAREGDQLILSDTSQWDSYNRIRLQ